MTSPNYKKIEFRQLSEVSPHAIIELMNDPDVRRHLPLAKGHFGMPEYKRFIAAKEQIWNEYGYGPWSFVLEDEFVGWGGVQPEGEDADIGLVLRKAYWGAGRVLYARIVDHAFGELGVDSVITLLPSSRTRLAGLQRLGFDKDGEIMIGEERFYRFRLTRENYQQ